MKPKDCAYHVGRAVLFLERFSLPQLARSCRGYHEAQIKEELERLTREGYLEKGEVEYELSKDPEKRLGLLDSLDAYEEPIPEAREPISKFYISALLSIAKAEVAKQFAYMPDMDIDLEEALNYAEEQLDIAFEDEGGVNLDTSGPVYLAIEAAKKRIKELRGKEQ
jgi:hypothetical protein